MNTLTSIAVSGMNAAQTQLQASANNIANLNTEGYHREEVAQSEQPQGGVSASLVRASQAGSDLESDVVTQLQAKNAFLANLAVFKTDKKMKGTLLDEAA
jgi:flagellar hook-associated protein FlgK